MIFSIRRSGSPIETAFEKIYEASPLFGFRKQSSMIRGGPGLGFDRDAEAAGKTQQARLPEIRRNIACFSRNLAETARRSPLQQALAQRLAWPPPGQTDAAR
jgi:hypothetical protein